MAAIVNANDLILQAAVSRFGSSDDLLTTDMKPYWLGVYSPIINEQAGIDAEATRYGITTEKTAYGAAITALTAYLGTLTGWNVIPGDNITIIGTTFRGKFLDVYAARQALLNKIAALADGRIDDAQSAASTAITIAATAQGTADGKVATFFQISAPTAEGVGDFWIDTDDGNKLYRWSGTAWASVQDAAIGTAITNAATAQSTADGKILSFYQAAAPTAEGVGDFWIDTDDGNKLYRWSGTAWASVQDANIATAQTDATNALNGLTAKLEASTSYTLTGVVIPADSGAIKCGNITWNTTTGALTGGSGIALTEYGMIGAKAGAAQFVIDTSGNATFSGTLSAGIITAASGAIDDLAVDTLQIAEDAVTATVSSFTDSYYEGNITTGDTVSLQTATTTTTGDKILITSSANISVGFAPPGIDTVAVFFRIKRGSTVIFSGTVLQVAYPLTQGSAIPGITIVDSPIAGTYTYTLEMLANCYKDLALVYLDAGYTIQYRSLTLTELKK